MNSLVHPTKFLQQRVQDIHRIIAASTVNGGALATLAPSRRPLRSAVKVVVLLVFLVALLVLDGDPHVEARCLLGLVSYCKNFVRRYREIKDPYVALNPNAVLLIVTSPSAIYT